MKTTIQLIASGKGVVTFSYGKYVIKKPVIVVGLFCETLIVLEQFSDVMWYCYPIGNSYCKCRAVNYFAEIEGTFYSSTTMYKYCKEVKI